VGQGCSVPLWLTALRALVFVLIGASAISVQVWLYSVGYSAWTVVVTVLLILAILCARESWRCLVAFVAALPVGFAGLVGGFRFWVWLVHVTDGQYFNDKGTGPLGVLLFSVVPAAALFALAFLGLGRILHCAHKEERR
jgi:hypothetical protein